MKRELVAIAIKIAIIWAALSSINFLTNNIFVIVIWPLTLGVLAIVWWKTGWIASRVVKNDGLIILGGKIQSQTIMAIACSILGIICLLRGIMSIGWALPTLLMNDRMHVYGVGSLLTGGINIFLGALLLVGANTVARAVIWLRTAGTRPGDTQA